MAKRYWLFKTEPDCFSIDHLKESENGVSSWEGVRNYQARNLLRDEVKKGDGVLFYHSSADPTGVAGLATVVKGAYPDPTARDPESQYFDPKATDDDPRWYMVDVQFEKKFSQVIPLTEMKMTPGLEDMMVTKRGQRLSIQPVKPEEWKIVLKMAK